MPVRPFCAVIVCVVVAACGGEQPVSPTPAAPVRVTGAVDGVVFHESYLLNRTTIPAGPQAGAQVSVTEGPGAGATMTTGADGAYHFDLPAGSFRLRWTAGGLETRDSDAGTVQAGATVRMTTVTLRLLSNLPIAEWSISGAVIDGRGVPVSGASVSAPAPDDLTYLAAATTDASGRFRMTSTRQHGAAVPVTVEKTGYERSLTSVACGDACAATVSVRLRRILRRYLDGPSSMRVGDTAIVDDVTDYDDGTHARVRANVLQSSNPAIVQVQPLVAPFDHVSVKALAAGDVTLTNGITDPLNVRVAP